MTDDLEGIAEDLAAVPVMSVVPATEFSADMERMAPLVEALVSGFAAGRVRMEDPDERLALVLLHERLIPVIERLGMARTMIERVFLQYAVDQQADRVRLPDDRMVVYEQGRGSYTTDAVRLRTELMSIAALDGTVSQAEVNDALRVEETVTPNHTRLNALVKRGGAVAEAIARHRQWVAPAATSGRVRFPR